MPQFNPCTKYQGRINGPISCSNAENSELPEFEAFDLMPRGPPPTDAPQTLSVVNMNMYENMNKVAHHTNKYDNSKLIVRRGQEFIVGIVFSRPFDPQYDQVNLEFLIGNNPSATQGTLITLSLTGNYQTNNWKVRVVGTLGTETKVAITAASNSIIGLFNTYVTVIAIDGKKRTKRNPRTDFYLLFNAWASSDYVYMENEAERTEYVLNDVGVIYKGVLDNITIRPWNFGQFQQGVLDACLFVLDFGQMPLQYRGDAVKLVRKASAMINSQDDNGVMVGNWSENYSLGTAPTAWTGSAEILLSYASKGGVPVKFAQCWVYAGVFSTLLRCLGLPVRIITTYSSAHDNMGDLTTDMVLDEEGRLDSNATIDSIWNFHCWNEVYMKRPEIPPNFSGWQVVDATPQETSDGYYRCGPTSVAAIKEGQLGFEYDAKFVFAEVNSDLVFHKRDKYGNMTTIYVDSTYVGQLIVTKMIGSNQPQNITNTYKYPEGSPQNALTMQRAMSRGMSVHRTSLPRSDVSLQLQAVQVTGSRDVRLTIITTNLNGQERFLEISLTGKTDYYTGATRSTFKFINLQVALKPWETKQEVITISEKEYKPFIMGQAFLSFIGYGYISDTGISLTSMAVIHLDTPGLFIEVTGDNQVGMDMYVNLKFTNTLGNDLNNVTLRMEGSDILPVKTKLYSVIEKGSSVKWIESFTPKTSGSKMLVACLDCEAMRNVCGQLEIFIQPETSGAA